MVSQPVSSVHIKTCGNVCYTYYNIIIIRRLQMIHSYQGKHPRIHDTVFVAANATIIGDVQIDEQSSIWFQTVIRGDVAPTTIGKRVNIQDLSLIHQSPDMPVTVEDDVTIGHQVTLHAATVRHKALIGMGSIILDGALVREHAFIGAASLVPPGKDIPPPTLAFGRPAKVGRELTEDDYADMEPIRQSYVERAQYYL